jgi:glutamine cyclotransferase
MKYIFAIMAAACLMVSCGGRGTAAKAADSSNAETAVQSPAPAASATPAADNPAADTPEATAAGKSAAPAAPKKYTYRVVKELPHDTGAYTQGLFWHGGYLYEGTGRNGRSELRKVDPATGKAVQSVKLGRTYFGEGIAMLDGLIYQLTWTEGRAFVYDAETFRQTRTFSYDGEGWGITTDGQKLYMSDGSENIVVRDPATFRTERTLTVTNRRLNVYLLNELEWIDGEIWANIYTSTDVVRIDPSSGQVTGSIDFSGIQSPADRLTDPESVLNGIARDPATGNIYVTGKRWNKVYQVEIVDN